MSEVQEVTLDFGRKTRTGLAEAIYCPGKSARQLRTITRLLVEDKRPMLFTRLSPDQHAVIHAEWPNLLDYDAESRTGLYLAPALSSPSPLAVVSGGSSDIPVAREAVRTLNFYGHQVLEVHDVGVAGLWRVSERLDELRTRKIIICIAGMDAALPTVLGGLVPAALFAVPTSAGYGMAGGGETALRSLLVSCAPGITVTNIDNGYGAACAAIRVLNSFTVQ